MAKILEVEQTSETERRGVTLRSCIIAALMSVSTTMVVNYVEYVVHASRMTLSHFPMGMLMLFLGLVLIVNPKLPRRYALSQIELVVVLAGGFVGGAIPSVGLTGYFLGAIAAPFYFATPENLWAQFFHPHIPTWLAPRNTNGALDMLFEGAPPGMHLPWHVWVVPVVCWMAFVLALFVASICMAVLLRKQWVVYERLTYPILRPILDLTELRDSKLPRLFWIGFAVAFGILCWNMIGYFIPAFPEIPNIRWGPWVGFERFFPKVWTRINMFTISFAYFANIDVLFSLWFFDLLFILRSGLLNRLGMNASSSVHASGDFAWMPLGAFFVLVAWSLWTARFHLKGVWRSALGKPSDIDASDELMSYRTSFIGLAVSIIFAIFWLWRAGMGFGVACLFIVAILALYIGVSRIVSEVGLVFVSMPVGAQSFVMSSVGSQNLSASSLTTLAFTNAINAYGKGLFMPAVTHGAKIADTCPKGDRRRVLGVMVLAFVCGTAASIVYTLYLGYTHGAYNFNDYPFTRYSRSGFSSVLSQMNNPAPPNTFRMTLFGVGAGMMALLTFLKYRFIGWPLHPIGFALAGSGTYMRYTVFSVFLAWAIKFVILRVGCCALSTVSVFLLGCIGRLYRWGSAFSCLGCDLVSGQRAFDSWILIGVCCHFVLNIKSHPHLCL